MANAIFTALLGLAIVIGITVWEFYYLISIAHAPNWAVFIFFALNISLGLKFASKS